MKKKKYSTFHKTAMEVKNNNNNRNNDNKIKKS